MGTYQPSGTSGPVLVVLLLSCPGPASQLSCSSGGHSSYQPSGGPASQLSHPSSGVMVDTPSFCFNIDGDMCSTAEDDIDSDYISYLGGGISSDSPPPLPPPLSYDHGDHGPSVKEATNSSSGAADCGKKTEPLRSVEEVMSSCSGTDLNSLRALTRELARDAVFGREVLLKNSLSGRKRTGTLEVKT